MFSIVQEKKAIRLYNDMTSNDPSIHCNRFPSWYELSDNQKQEYRDKAKESEK